LHSMVIRSIFSLACYVTVTWAMYYMDDRNTSIIYSTNNTNVKFSRLELGVNYTTFPFVSSIKYAYNNTLTLNYCFTEDGCEIIIPFTGSGITLYMIQISDAANFTVQVDSGVERVKTLQYLDGSWSNITLDDIQSLPYGAHLVTVAAKNWTDAGGGKGSQSSVLFDYAAVNETVASLPSSGSSSSAGDIAIGVVVLVGIPLLIVAVALCYRKSIKRFFFPNSKPQVAA